MKVIVFLTIVLNTLVFHTFAQCPTGAIGVSGAGCGCLAGCNLTALGGPNCSGATGNCSAGQVAMSVDIPVPAGCTITVTATMSNRGGSCSASGADSGDQLKVDIPGGPKPFQTGASNATLNDSYVLVGPGTIRVSGTANRADEIITYNASSTGCVNCSTGLPVELTAFQAQQELETVACSWNTETERDNDYFTVERSSDGIHFDAIGYHDGAGNSQVPLAYKLYDSSPLNGLSYYRLRQTDFNGSSTLSEVVSVVFSPSAITAGYLSDQQLLVFNRQLAAGTSIRIYSSLGQLLVENELSESSDRFWLPHAQGIVLIEIRTTDNMRQTVRTFIGN